MSDINYLNAFEGGKSGSLKVPDFSLISSLEDLPRELRITYSNIAPDASFAAFVCFCDSKGIPAEMIAGRSGLSEAEVISLVKEAKEALVYKDLVGEFLKE